MNEHDTTHWHPPLGHHHGSDPRQSPLWDMYLQATGQEIGYPWLSSYNENIFPFPAGKHEGFTFLAENDTNNDQSDRDAGNNYISRYLLMVHTLGDGHAIRTRFHSHYGVFKVTDGKGNTGMVATGGHGDYGVWHNFYKERVIPLPGDPAEWPYGDKKGFGLPYRASLKPDGDNVQFWNSQGQGRKSQFPHQPNNILQLAWKQLDCWSRPDEGDPTNPMKDIYPCPDGSCDFNGSLFQVNAIRLLRLPVERPFVGFTDVHGHVIDADAPGPNAVPLIITKNVPQGDAVLSREFQRGGCEDGPCLDFDDGSPLYAPGLGGQHG
jgi:hypothetical protein